MYTFTVPDAPSELSYTVKGVEVTLSWSAPVKDKGGITGYSVAVKESSSQQTIEPLKDVGLMESYFFNGSWNTEYDVEVQFVLCFKGSSRILLSAV